MSRASHTHQAPHIGLPQSEPVSSAKAVNDAPMGAQAAANTSASLTFHTSATAPAPAMSMYTNMDIHAAGTWINMMRTVSPCW